MFRTFWKPVVALGAVLAATGAASAGDQPGQLTGGPVGSTTMTLGGKGTAAQAATEDTELARGHGGGFHGGFHGGYGGFGGYRGGYYGGYRGGYYGGYRGYYGGFYRPYYPYYAGFGYGLYGYGGYGLYGYGGYGGYGYGYPYYYPPYSYPTVGVYLGISGGTTASGAPTLPLGTTNFARPVAPPMTQPAAPSDGTFPYDGGPATPVPLPKGDPQLLPPASPSASATDLPISLKPKAAPYKYKAYGEK